MQRISCSSILNRLSRGRCQSTRSKGRKSTFVKGSLKIWGCRLMARYRRMCRKWLKYSICLRESICNCMSTMSSWKTWLARKKWRKGRSKGKSRRLCRNVWDCLKAKCCHSPKWLCCHSLLLSLFRYRWGPLHWKRRSTLFRKQSTLSKSKYLALKRR